MQEQAWKCEEGELRECRLAERGGKTKGELMYLKERLNRMEQKGKNGEVSVGQLREKPFEGKTQREGES